MTHRDLDALAARARTLQGRSASSDDVARLVSDYVCEGFAEEALETYLKRWVPRA